MLELHGDSPQRPTATGSLAAAAEFAGLLDAAATEQERLCLGARLVAELLGREAGLMLRARPDAGPTAASVPGARDADHRQIELDEGPSLDALRNATIVVATGRELDHRRLALEHRTVIGQAVGILMERHRLSADQAFAMLREASQRTNHKLRDIAERLTATGELL